MAGSKLNWASFKEVVLGRKLAIQWREVKNVYWLTALDGPFSFDCIIRISVPAEDEDQIDFETNFKTNPSTSIIKRDAEGYELKKQKVTKGDRYYQKICGQFVTATANSLRYDDADGNAIADASISFWKDVNGVLTEMTKGELSDNDWQTALDTDCIETRIDWEAPYDYEIIGGAIQCLTAPSQRCPIFVIAIPDLPSVLGGNKAFVLNYDLQFLPNKGEIVADGRAVKELPYSFDYHTNKLSLRVKHGITSEKIDIQLIFDHFRD